MIATYVALIIAKRMKFKDILPKYMDSVKESIESQGFDENGNLLSVQ